MATEWIGDASAMVLYTSAGRVNLARAVNELGEDVWRQAQEPMSGGPPSKPIKGTEPLTPPELLWALRKPLGG